MGAWSERWRSLAIGLRSGTDAMRGLLPFNDAASPATTLGLTPGFALDRAGGARVALPAAITKRIDAAWQPGSGNGGLDAGSVAPTTGYHIHMIRNPGTEAVDCLFSTSATNPILPFGFDHVARVAAFVTNAAGQVAAGCWYADGSFSLKSCLLDFSSVSTSPYNPRLLGLKIPRGVKLRVRYNLAIVNPVAQQIFVDVRDPDVGVPSAGDAWSGRIFKPSAAPLQTRVEEWTDSGGNWYLVSNTIDANTAITGYLTGWFDPRDADG